MESRRIISAFAVTLLVTVAGARVAAADQLILKSGEKVVGTIVGFENGMFRVETDFGIALVRRDKVASIQISDSINGPTQPASSKSPPAESPVQKVKQEPRPAPASPPPVPLIQRVKQEPRPETASAAPRVPKPEAAPPPRPAKPPAPVSRPLDEPLPAHLQEHVEGTTFFSDTFHFSMFKPPDWKIYEGVPRETGSGIMAMGTENEQTLLIVDRQVWSGPPDLKADQVMAKLRQNYQDFQRLSEETVECDGHPAMRRTFTGVLDGAEWHGIALHVVKGNTVFGIIGLTSAELFEFQQAVLNKIVKSFHFEGPALSPAAKPGTSPAP